MGVITISIDDDTEKKFRETAKKKLGERKGYLGEATTEALELWVQKQMQEEIAQRALELLGRKRHLGNLLYTTRQDIHDRGTRTG